MKALSFTFAVSALLAATNLSHAQHRGVTRSEIKIGQTISYSGPVSAFSLLGKGELAYFKMVNERGGINGRMINLISLDDNYSPQNCRADTSPR